MNGDKMKLGCKVLEHSLVHQLTYPGALLSIIKPYAVNQSLKSENSSV